MRLTKLHGLGNDFLVTLEERGDAPDGLTAPLARALCDRHRGIGADGLILGRRPASGQEAGLVMELRNADGSTAEMSGNGIRCLAHAVALERGVDALDLLVATDGGPRSVAVRDASGACTVSVGMGDARPGPPLPPELDQGDRLATVDVGNPHLVVDVDDPTAVDLATAGPAYESHFAGGINVEFIHVRDRGALTLTVWERGAGITEACGTGAVAAVHAAHTWGLVDTHVRVDMPGGSAEVVLGETLTLIGPSVHIAEIHVDADALLRSLDA